METKKITKQIKGKTFIQGDTFPTKKKAEKECRWILSKGYDCSIKGKRGSWTVWYRKPAPEKTKWRVVANSFINGSSRGYRVYIEAPASKGFTQKLIHTAKTRASAESWIKSEGGRSALIKKYMW